MIKFFKIFESEIKNKNPMKWKGIPFWIGIVDLLDGEIISTWTYQKAEIYDLHHSLYMDKTYLEKIDDEEYGVFWFNNPNDLDFWDYSGITSDIVKKIKKQIIST